CVNTLSADPNDDSADDLCLAYVPGGAPGDPNLGWHSNGRSGEIFWWERGPTPRTPVYPYLRHWTDGMTIQKVSGETVRVVEWVRGMDAWRETDLVDPGDTVTIDHSDLTMNAGSGPVGGDELDCTLIENVDGDGDVQWTIRLWNYYEPAAATSASITPV